MKVENGALSEPVWVGPNLQSHGDGAAALVLVSGEKASQLGLHVIAKISGYSVAAQAREAFTTAPALAIPKAIAHAGLDASEIDNYEINEAFSAGPGQTEQRRTGPDRTDLSG